MSTLLPVLTDYEKSHLSERQPLPEQYVGLSDAEMDARIAAARAKLGKRLVILGHHYQRDEVIKFADYTGDSYKLSQLAARWPTWWTPISSRCAGPISSRWVSVPSCQSPTSIQLRR